MIETICYDFINQYGTLISNTFHEALTTWYQTISHDGFEHKNRTRSSYTWDAFFDILRVKLKEDKNIHFVEQYGSVLLIYKQLLLIKMKKMGHNKRPSFIPTIRASKFQNQFNMGFGNLYNVYLCYQLDRTNIDIDSIMLLYERGHELLGLFPIDTSIIQAKELFYKNTVESQSYSEPPKQNRIHLKEKQNATAI
jgi:hypothetical protein